MNTHLLEIGCIKKHGDEWNSLWKGHDEIVDKVLDPNKCETSVTKMRSFSPISL